MIDKSGGKFAYIDWDRGMVGLLIIGDRPIGETFTHSDADAQKVISAQCIRDDINAAYEACVAEAVQKAIHEDRKKGCSEAVEKAVKEAVERCAKIADDYAEHNKRGRADAKRGDERDFWQEGIRGGEAIATKIRAQGATHG